MHVHESLLLCSQEKTKKKRLFFTWTRENQISCVRVCLHMFFIWRISRVGIVGIGCSVRHFGAPNERRQAVVLALLSRRQELEEVTSLAGYWYREEDIRFIFRIDWDTMTD